MTSSSDLRAFVDGDPTGRFETEQLDALLAHSLEASTVFAKNALGSSAPPAPPPRPPLPPPRAPSLSGQFLTKGSPVLVLPEARPEPAREPMRSSAPPPPLRPPPEVLPSVVVEFEALAPPAALPIVTTVIARAPRAREARRVAVAKTRRRPVLKFFFKLALLALVVACQPGWWNVGDLHPARDAAPPR